MRTGGRRIVTAIVAAIVAVAGCRARRATESSAPEATGGSVTYRLAWSWDGGRWDEAARVFRFRTDRGYEVALEEAQVGVASLELVPCKLTEVEPTPGRREGALAWLAPAEAWANHGYVHDPTLVSVPVVDSPFLPGPRPFGAAQAPGRTYCRLHELLAPLDAANDGLRLERASAQVRGSFLTPGGETRRFDGKVGLRGGALVDLGGGPRVAGGASLTVTVVRAPARAFDGVALEALSPSETAYAFLRGLAKGTRADVDGGLPN